MTALKGGAKPAIEHLRRNCRRNCGEITAATSSATQLGCDDWSDHQRRNAAAQPGRIAFFHRRSIWDWGADRHQARIGPARLTQEPRLFETGHCHDLCDFRSSQTSRQHMAMLAVSHDDNTQTFHRPHDATLCDTARPGLRRPSISHDHPQPNGTGISFFCQYYLRLHRRRHLTIDKSPDGETTNAHVVFVHGRLVRALSVVECSRHMQLQHRARPHQWT